jgi:hypothetical protein
VASWGGYGTPDLVTPAFGASPTDDLVMVPGTSDEPGVHAYRLSDRSRLPASPLPALPLAFTRDGRRAFTFSDGELRATELADGSVVSRVAAAALGPMDVSADGRTVALGGRGADLLRVWHTEGAALTPVCETDDRTGTSPTQASLSADGQIVALGWNGDVRLLRRSDGSRAATLSGDGPAVTWLNLAPDARHVFAEREPAQDAPFESTPSLLWRVADGERLAALTSPNVDGWYWGRPAFAPGGGRLYIPRHKGTASELQTFDLDAGGAVTARPVTPYRIAIGEAARCPLLFDQTRGAWRSCETCEDPPFAAGARDAIASLDGRFVVTRDAEGTVEGTGGGVTLWRVSDAPAPLRTIPRRPEEAAWDAREIPVAIATDGTRIVTGAEPDYLSCYAGPSFEVRVHDAADGHVIDTLPPGPSALDAQARTLAYGAQLWCAR